MYLSSKDGGDFAVLQIPGHQIAFENFASHSCAFVSAVLAIYAIGKENSQPQGFIKLEDLLAIAAKAIENRSLRDDGTVLNWQNLTNVVCKYFGIRKLYYYWSNVPTRFCVGNIEDKHFVFISHTSVDDLRSGNSKTIANGGIITNYRCWGPYADN